VALVAATGLVAGCGGSPGSAPPTTNSESVSAAPASSSSSPPATGSASAAAASASVWRLRYVLLSHYPDFAYCDPDSYPVARADQQAAADAWWTSVNRGSAEVQAIVAQHALQEPITAAQRLTAYSDHKKLNAIAMTEVSGGYEYTLSTGASGQPDHTVSGMVGLDGSVREASRRTAPGGCPICLEAGTRIATPFGDVPVSMVRPGDTVWTTDATGRRVAAPVVQVTSRSTPGPHLMLRLALSDGRVLVAAGAHPAADGTFLRQLRIGEAYDGATVAAMDWVPSTASMTFDILPAGSTGTYWANGILVGSTLKH
jgi:hypothetical protein